MADNNRTRTFTWDDPLQIAAAAMGVSGMEFLAKFTSGEVPMPPIARTLDYTMESAEEGRAVFVGTPEWEPITTWARALMSMLGEKISAAGVEFAYRSDES